MIHNSIMIPLMMRKWIDCLGASVSFHWVTDDQPVIAARSTWSGDGKIKEKTLNTMKSQPKGMHESVHRFAHLALY